MRLKKADYKVALVSLITLSIPTILEEVFATLLQYVDTAMVGRLGEKATAAVSTTTSIGWLINSIPGAIAIAMLAIASKANGAGQDEKLKKLAGQSILYAFVVGVILEILALVLSPFIPIWMGVEDDIVRPASLYFSITSITLIFRTSARVFAAMIRSLKDTRSPMYISVAENILNVILNFVFIYGLGLGVVGAAIASCISFGIGGIAMFLMMLSKKQLRPSFVDLKPDKDIWMEALPIGYPVLGATVVSCMGYIVFAGMVSGMGTIIFAAHSIAVTAEQIVDTEIFLYNRMPTTTVGLEQEYVAGGRLDDLQCVFAGLQGFLAAEAGESVPVFCMLDNEEVGSGTKQGAAATFLKDALQRINMALGRDEEDYLVSLANSLMLSADNAHAVHPNHTDKNDLTNKTYPNEGVVVKYSANQKYTTDAVSGALVQLLAKKADVPLQLF